jgi:ribosomal protein S21
MLGESDRERKLYDTSTTACNRAATELQQRKLHDTSTPACNRAPTELQQRKLYDTSATTCNRAATELQQRKLYDTSTTALAGKTESQAEKAFQDPPPLTGTTKYVMQ